MVYLGVMKVLYKLYRVLGSPSPRKSETVAPSLAHAYVERVLRFTWVSEEHLSTPVPRAVQAFENMLNTRSNFSRNLI